ncbi:hypothetical protein [Streptomyces heilongjiangensis]|uniref:Uncharacterized protein n=1 Tax=Streptomyces heilongjiangensis TaxID=945052 RepID=A0ABW1BGV5_9ACTN|nr:hypothetical protein [Streptomyces heilongjiangensis]MDC2952596.1 hypothetical protein [Streptomyces heilongjiangensis]
MANPGSARFWFDTRTAQTRLLGRDDALSAIGLTAGPGVSDAELRANTVARLGAVAGAYTVRTKAERAADQKPCAHVVVSGWRPATSGAPPVRLEPRLPPDANVVRA